MSPDTVLVALVKSPADHAILHRQHWYRIPVDKSPKLVSERRVRYLGFYLPGAFGEALRWQIHHYGQVKRIVEASRRELFPEEPAASPKAATRYYKIELESLQALPQPIVSRRGHRLVFVPTTEEKFFRAGNLNSLFHASPLEDSLFARMEALGIAAERQWLEYVDKNRRYFLDFAIFCQQGKIDVECDGDRYHNAPDQVQYDKHRNNELTTLGWSVLRYTTADIEGRLDRVMEEIVRNIHQCQGLATDEGATNSYITLPFSPQQGQGNLFE